MKKRNMASKFSANFEVKKFKMVQMRFARREKRIEHFAQRTVILNHFHAILNIFFHFVVNQRKSRTFAPGNHGMVLVNSL